MSGREGLDEIHRYVDHQIETERYYRNQAVALLRVVLSAFSVIITVLSVSISVGGLAAVSPSVIAEELSSLASEINASSYFVQPQGEIMVGILVMFCVTFIIFSLIEIFVFLPRHALKSLDVSRSETELLETKRAPIDGPSTKSEEIISAYDTITDHNESVLETTRQNLDRSFRAIRTGILSFVIGIAILIPSILLDSPEYAVAAVLGPVLWVMGRFARQTSLNTIQNHIFISPYHDLGGACLGFAFIIISSVGALTPTQKQATTIVSVIGVALLSVSIVKSSSDILPNLYRRNLAIFSSSALLVAFLFIIDISYQKIPPIEVIAFTFTLLFGSAIATIYHLSLSVTVLIIKENKDWILQWASKLKTAVAALTDKRE
ncbi:hypothetical protein [Natronomonas sp. EA1]|uniref:hypothetical protein n=1 Tax=Natronomonas sp. EA1 TaxID=3421655 RepID=UPI003EB9D3DB